MKMLLLIATLFGATAQAATGKCDLDLFKISFRDTPMGQIVVQDKLESKTAEVAIPADSDPYASYSLYSTIGDFHVSAMFEAGEKIVSNVNISDETHSTDFQNDFASFSNFKTMRKVSVYCSYKK